MTDDHEQLSEPDATVRRLLADARHTEPIPDDVAARLDATLTELAAEPSRVRPVTDLATRRRRVSRLLLAAAAVVVVGVGVQQVVSPRVGSRTTEDSSVASLRESTPPDGGDTNDSTSSTSSGQQDAPEATGEEGVIDGAGQAPLAASEPVRLRPRHFAKDAAAQASSAVARDLRVGGAAMAYDAAGVTCRAGSWGRGTFVPVRYGRAPAVLVLRRPLGDTRVADLFLCGSTEPVRSVTLPAP